MRIFCKVKRGINKRSGEGSTGSKVFVLYPVRTKAGLWSNVDFVQRHASGGTEWNRFGISNVGSGKAH